MKTQAKRDSTLVRDTSKQRICTTSPKSQHIEKKKKKNDSQA